MAERDGDRWEKARTEMMARWRGVLERIDAHDEGGALAQANVMDEFCEEASSDRQSALKGSERPFEPLPVVPAATQTRCRFCLGFIAYGGCFGTLDRFNRAVSGGNWDEARRIGRDYLALLESMASNDVQDETTRETQPPLPR